MPSAYNGIQIRGYMTDEYVILQRVTAQLTAGTERNLAERAGHLELLAGGKKDKKKKQDVGKKP
jgi:hypothetical protein